MSIDLSAQRQYLQRAVNVKHSFTATTQQTLYTSPNGGSDFNFSVIMGIFACDHGNQQTNLDISIVDTSSNEFFLFKEYLTSISQIAVLLYYIQFIYIRLN